MGKQEKIEKFIIDGLQEDAQYWVGRSYGFDVYNDDSYFEIEEANIYFSDEDLECELSGTGYLHLETALINSEIFEEIRSEKDDIYNDFDEGSVEANKKVDELWARIQEKEGDLIDEIEEWVYDTLDMINYNDLPMSQYEVKVEINDSRVSTISMEELLNFVAPGARYYNTIGSVKPVLVGFEKETLINYIW